MCSEQTCYICKCTKHVISTRQQIECTREGAITLFRTHGVNYVSVFARRVNIPQTLFRCARPSAVPRGPANSSGSLASQRHPGSSLRSPAEGEGVEWRQHHWWNCSKGATSRPRSENFQGAQYFQAQAPRKLSGQVQGQKQRDWFKV